VPSLEEKIANLIRDIRWVIFTAARPDDEEFKLTARFLLLLVFVAGAFQLVFHVASVYIRGAVYGQWLAPLDPVRESIAILTSLIVVFAATLYLLAKLR